MRHPREITAEEENFRLEEFAPGHGMVKRDPVKPEPEGTYVIMAFRITGYDPDCDGSLMARMVHVSFDTHDESGWHPTHIGLYKGSDIVVSEEELHELYLRAEENNGSGV